MWRAFYSIFCPSSHDVSFSALCYSTGTLLDVSHARPHVILCVMINGTSGICPTQPQSQGRSLGCSFQRNLKANQFIAESSLSGSFDVSKA